MKTREQAAEEYAKNKCHIHDRQHTEWATKDFLAGCSHVDQEHREFYLLVREFMSDSPKNQPEINRLTKIIDWHLAAFTERDLLQLPFQESNPKENEHYRE